MFYVGMDIHRDNFHGVIMNGEGKVINSGTFPSRKEGIRTCVAGIPSSHLEITIEACGQWRGFYKKVKELGYSVVLANPKKVKDIAGDKKTDQVNARDLADLLRTGYLPEVYIPSEDILKVRDLARDRVKLVRLRTRIQTRIKSYLANEGINYSQRLWNKKGIKRLKKLEDDRIKRWVRIIETLEEQIKEATTQVKSIAVNKEKAILLQTMPGIGEISSLLMLGEIGDIKRFPSPKKLISYGGLCPGIYQTGNTQRATKKVASNKWIKWILTECSGIAIRYDGKLRKYYYKVKRRKGFQTARRAVARKMLKIMWHMLRNEEPYKAS